MSEAIREYPQFNDANGKELNNGFIYIGEEHKDPKSRPIDVYWDEGLTVPAAQPLRTHSGYISRAGAPSKIWTASAYSIGVYTRQGRNVYTSLSDNGALFGIEAKIDAINADLVILDYHLPKRDGLEVIAAIKEAHPEVPVIVLTGYLNPESEKQFNRLGASKIFPKPFNYRNLLDAVKDLSSESALQSEPVTQPLKQSLGSAPTLTQSNPYPAADSQMLQDSLNAL